MKKHVFSKTYIGLLSFLLFVGFYTEGVAQCNRQNDSLELVRLYNATNGANWANKWILTQSMTTWYGVTLNTEGCVLKIELNANNLKGELPNLNLPNLQVLSLWQNQLNGVIPQFNLPNLKILDINTNKSLGGQMPDFNLPNLEHLNLGADSLTGNIPSSIGQLSQLKYIQLGPNNLTGSIPASIGSLSLLETLILGSNKLTGVIPPEIGNCRNLKGLYLNSNPYLTGSIPNSIGNLKRLRAIWIGNILFDTIPESIGTLDSLEDLVLSDNRFTGKIPALFNQLKVKRLWLQSNRLDSLPNLTNLPLTDTIAVAVLGGMRQLAGLVVHSNALTFDDILPNMSFAQSAKFLYAPQDSIYKDTTITARVAEPLSIDLNIDATVTTNSYKWFKNGTLFRTPTNSNKLFFNNLQATDAGVYTCEVTNPNAWLLTLYSRKITVVTIPNTSCRFRDSLVLAKLYNTTGGQNWIKNGQPIRWDLSSPINTPSWKGITLNTEGCVTEIFLDSSNLQGINIPVEIGNLSELKNLSLYGNRGLSGSIPTTITNLSNLEYLALDGCSLSGSIPDSIGKLKKLLWFHVFNNKLTGTIPNSICDLVNLTNLGIYNNLFDSPIPENIGNLVNLEVFHGDSAKLRGRIPDSFGNLRKLKSLHLFRNNLLGDLPISIRNLINLTDLNLHLNQFTGSILNLNLPNLNYINLTSNQFTGNIPNFNSPDLQYIYLGINKLDGQIPNFNLLKLEDLFIDNNKLNGVIPIFNLPKLKRLGLYFNQLTGNIPNFNVSDTVILSLSNNKLSGIVPRFTRARGIALGENKFTFDGILPNIQNQNYTYIPQDSIFKDTTYHLTTGSNLTIDLGIDGALTTNKYVWFKKQGNTWTRFDSSNVNTLILRGVSACDAGDYKCEVTNPNAPLLTLKSKTIKIVVNGALSSNRLDTAICYGQTYRLPNLQTASATTNFRDTVKNIRQCDSLIRIVNLTISSKPDSTVQNAAICFGKTYTLPNGQIVAPSVNTIYRDTILLNGCPSRFRVTNLTINVLPMPIVNDTAICSGNSARLWIRNNTPNFRNYQWQTNSATTASANYTPSVSSTFFVTVTDANGCIGTDSARITVNSKPTAQITNLNSIYCKDNSIVTLQGQPTGGTFRLDGNTALNFNTNAVGIGNHSLNYIYRDVNNCADTATQTFRLADMARSTINRTICSGDSLRINNKVYHKNRLTGIDTLRGASKDGCDSILTVQIAVYPKVTARNDSVTIEQNKTDTTINVLTNDTYPNNQIDVNIKSKPQLIRIDEKGTGLFNIQMPRAANGYIVFSYELCPLSCPSDCDTALVKVVIKNGNPKDPITTAITPNGDGMNDALDFPDANLERHPENAIEIYNRWGQLVYKASPYKRDWSGQDLNGQLLPAGDYFFIMRVSIGDGQIIVGSVYLSR